MLGKKLTDDAVIESLERLEMDVIYDFGSVERRPSLTSIGLHQKRTDYSLDSTSQDLNAVFLHVTPGSGYTAFSLLIRW